jgi:exopolyphosphatase/guanosine-5'-triphosphate,3'-diphosphate pyrophosphatase
VRLGVLDVGSNTVHLLVVDAHPGAHPDPVGSHKTALRLSELVGADGSLGERGRGLLVAAVADAVREAQDQGLDDLVAFATSAVREATDGAAALEQVRAETGVELVVMPGEHEAAMTFLAVRRWFGWSAGRVLVLDIGGGSLEVACGRDEQPDLALSVPLGAGRLTRDLLPSDPPGGHELAALREHVWRTLEPVVLAVAEHQPVDRMVCTSKTFRTLARIDGAAPTSMGPLVRRTLTRAGLERITPQVCALTAEERQALPGVSAGRARQLAAGAVVALEAFEALGVQEAEICPWAMREGVVLRRLDWLVDEAGG